MVTRPPDDGLLRHFQYILCYWFLYRPPIEDADSPGAKTADRSGSDKAGEYLLQWYDALAHRRAVLADRAAVTFAGALGTLELDLSLPIMRVMFPGIDNTLSKRMVRIFRDNGPFINMCKKVIQGKKAFTKWIEHGSMPIYSLLSPSACKILAAHNIDTSRAVLFKGYLEVYCVGDGKVRFSLLERLSKEPASEEDGPEVLPFPPIEKQQWMQQASSRGIMLDRFASDMVLFSNCAKEAVRACSTNIYAETEECMCVASSLLPQDRRTVFVFLTHDPDEFEGQFIRFANIGFEVAEANEANSIVLCTNISADRLRSIIRREGLGSFRVIDRYYRFDVASLISCLSLVPYVWSKYFGKDLPMRILFGRNDEELHSSICRGAFSSMLRTDLPEHPALASEEIGRSQLIRVIGRPGSGRSVAAYQIMRRYFADAVVLAVKIGYRLEDEPLLIAIVQYFESRNVRTVVLFDDCPFPMAPGLDEAVRSLLRGLEHQRLSTVLLCYTTDHKLQVESDLQIIATAGCVVLLDDPPLSHVEDIIHLGLASFTVKQGEDCNVADAAARFHAWDDTPLSILSVLYGYRGGILDKRLLEGMQAPASVYWVKKYQGLLRQNNFVQCRVLQLLSLFSIMQERTVTVQLLDDVFAHCEPAAVARLQDVVGFLVNEGWLAVGDDGIAWHDVSLAPARRAVLVDVAPHGLVEQFCDWLLTTAMFDEWEKRTFLWRFGTALIHEGYADKAVDVFRATRARFPDDVTAGISLGEALWVTGDVAAAKHVFLDLLHADGGVDGYVLSAILRLLDLSCLGAAMEVLRAFCERAEGAVHSLNSIVSEFLRKNCVEACIDYLRWHLARFGFYEQSFSLVVLLLCERKDYASALEVISTFGSRFTDDCDLRTWDLFHRSDAVKRCTAVCAVGLTLQHYVHNGVHRVWPEPQFGLADLCESVSENTVAELLRAMEYFQSDHMELAVVAFEKYFAVDPVQAVRWGWLQQDFVRALVLTRRNAGVLALLERFHVAPEKEVLGAKCIALLELGRQDDLGELLAVKGEAMVEACRSLCSHVLQVGRWRDVVDFCTLTLSLADRVPGYRYWHCLYEYRAEAYLHLGEAQLCREDCVVELRIADPDWASSLRGLRLLGEAGFGVTALELFYGLCGRMEGRMVSDDDLVHCICGALLREGRKDLFFQFRNYIRERRAGRSWEEVLYDTVKEEREHDTGRALHGSRTR